MSPKPRILERATKHAVAGAIGVLLAAGACTSVDGAPSTQPGGAIPAAAGGGASGGTSGSAPVVVATGGSIGAPEGGGGAASAAPPAPDGPAAGGAGAVAPPPDAGMGGDAGAGSVVSPAGFKHPGIMVDAEQLAFVRSKIAAGAEPWTSALERARRSRQGSLSYAARPVPIVECGPYSNPSTGCEEERGDASAAYTQALLWAFSGDEAHAEKAAEIIDAWSAVLEDHTNSNAPLQSAWSAVHFPRAAEILRYTYASWPEENQQRFADMLTDVYLPELIDGSNSNGNWELSMAEAVIAIGVFNDDRQTFERGLEMWRGRVPAYIYLEADGELPRQAPAENRSRAQLIRRWGGQSTFFDGLCQETCRDFFHLQLGFASMINGAETARIQGVDLFGEEAERITKGYEVHAQYLLGAPVPSSLCDGELTDVRPTETWEIGYNEYANRRGMALPFTRQLVADNRPTTTSFIMAWETLTHAETAVTGPP